MRRILWTVLLVAVAATVPAGIAGATDTQLRLTTTYTGLYPDADVRVPVTVHNPMPSDVAVHTADVQVGNASAACPSSYLEVSSFSGDVVAPALGDVTLPIRLHMLASAPNGCQGATFPLTFTASGAPVGNQDRGSGGFAFTGADAGLVALLGVGALTSGSILLLGRRRSSEAS